ncbi:hypothetical protein QCA50_003396 [Cerrena zonata]|uniref:Uncharacterized protein n=1 Tax=Cerrena zonata TaxID=2478898 RepID=A0AAW0GPS5_9APHY
MVAAERTKALPQRFLSYPHLPTHPLATSFSIFFLFLSCWIHSRGCWPVLRPLSFLCDCRSLQLPPPPRPRS